MNKSELIGEVALKTGMTKKDSEKAITAVIDAITAALEAGEKVQLTGLGIFDVKERAAHIGRNPMTREEIEIPASRVPVFKPGKALKDTINK